MDVRLLLFVGLGAIVLGWLVPPLSKFAPTVRTPTRPPQPSPSPAPLRLHAPQSGSGRRGSSSDDKSKNGKGTERPEPTAARADPPTPSAHSPQVVGLEGSEERLHWAIFGLRDTHPGLTASQTLSRGQRRVIVAAGISLVALTIINVRDVAIALMAICTMLYLSAITFRLRLYRLSSRATSQLAITEEEAFSIPDDELPSYTVMVPAFNEPTIVRRLIDSLGRLDYPQHLLDVMLLLEADDHVTVEMAMATPGVERFRIVLVPPSEPRTKPKALNYGLQVATGELLTIYDAEDRPEPLQLRRAVYAMEHAPPRTACLQAQLAYYNPGQNLITRWFTIEYLMWFTQFLPGLAILDAPLPLGGTSNHFRTEILREVGGWDPFNVTEDADLGVRLHRSGYRTGVLASQTMEEANSDFVNWIRQRSRWYKGYLQAWLVHLRSPRRLWREVGPRGFLRFNLFVGGTPILALLNPVFWTMTLLWFVAHPAGIRQIFPAPVYFAAVSCWLIGNFAFLYMVLLVAMDTDDVNLLAASALTPAYWIMMSVAAIKAAWQLATQPNYWEKTVHGLDDAALPVPVPTS